MACWDWRHYDRTGIPSFVGFAKLYVMRNITRIMFSITPVSWPQAGTSFYPAPCSSMDRCSCPVHVYDTELMALCGGPICVSTLSNHCKGPCRRISIQHGVDVTS